MFCLGLAITAVESSPMKEASKTPQLIQLQDQIRHDRLQLSVIQFAKESVIRPVGWHRFHDTKAAVMGDKPVIIHIVGQVGDLGEPFALHDDKRADHSFSLKTPPPGRRHGQREVQAAEEFVVEHGGTLECEKRYIPNNSLSVDCDNPLSG